MNKRTFFLILAGLCLAASVILVVVGVKRAEQKPMVDGLKSLGRITLTYDEEKTVNAMSGKRSQTPDPEEDDEPYTVVFTNNQTQYGLIRYDLGVDTKEEFDELTAATADFVYTGDVFIEEGEPTQTLRKSTRQLYVYAWPKTEEESKNTPEDENSRFHFRFYDDLMSMTDVEKQIEADLAVEQDSCASASVSSTVYFIIAAIPLLGGAYLAFLAFAGPRSKQQN